MGLAASIINISWGRVLSTVCTIILLSLIVYGAYEFYFNKPVPIINNHYVAMPNSNQTINQPKKSRATRFAVGIIATNNNTYGAHISFLF